MKEGLALGVDLGWVSQLESQGYIWIDEDGTRIDPILACKNMGANAVRLRVFVNPPQDAYWQKTPSERCMLGFCDTDHVLEMAGRVKEMDMDLMLDFHYSDHFADPVIQDIPMAWKDDSEEELINHLSAYTTDTLSRFTEWHLAPRWVQVGNEINNGMMWPNAKLQNNPDLLVRCLNAGHDAVKELCPDTLVITHLSAVHDESLCLPFLEHFLARDGKTDLFGFSYYPYWAQIPSNREKLYVALAKYRDMTGKPVLITEVGGPDEDEETSYSTILDCLGAVRAIPDNQGSGVFYWEPDAHRSVVPDGYPLGACVPVGKKRLRFTKAITAFRSE